MLKSLLLSFQTPLYILKSVGTFLGNPSLLGLCVVPGISGLIASLLGMITAFVYRAELTAMIGLNPDSWYFSIVGLLVFFAGCMLSALAGFVTASIAGGYFVELIIEKLLARYGVRPPTDSESTTQVLISIARASVNEIILVVGVLLCTMLAFGLSFLPFLACFPLAMGAFVAGFSLFNLPLGILNVPLGQRLKIVKQQLLPCFALGACFSAVLLIPMGSIFLLPAFYGAAVEILSKNELLQEFSRQ